MSEAGVEFLTSVALSDRIRHVCAGTNVRCAVAFWGAGVASSLFPQGLEQVTLVCDISMQGTPRSALLEMGAPLNPQLLVRDGLHSKIYISNRGAVVASANASGNGIGLVPGASGRLVEAGIFCQVGTAAFDSSEAEIERLIAEAVSVKAEDLDRAPERSCEPRPALPIAELRRLPLLSAFKEAPSVFTDLSVALVTEPEIDWREAEKVRGRYLNSIENVDTDEVGVVFVGDDGDGEIDTLSSNVLMFFMPTGLRSKWSMTLYTRVLLLPRKKPVFGFAFAGAHRAKGRLRELIRNSRPSDAEWDLLHRVSEHFADRWAYTPEDFSDALASVAALPGNLPI